MINREKVIRHIAAEISIARTCKKDFASVDIDMLSDAYELLKEQEPVKPVKEQIFSFIFGWVCGACNFPLLNDGYMYCPHCGKKVNWE